MTLGVIGLVLLGLIGVGIGICLSVLAVWAIYPDDLPDTRQVDRTRYRPVLFDEELAGALAERVEWGEPDKDGWYTPTLYRGVPK